MSKKPSQEQRMSVLDAVEALAAIAEMNISEEEVKRLSEESLEEKTLLERNLEEPKTLLKNPLHARECFKTIHSYLKRLYDENQLNLKDGNTQKGIKAIVQIAEEAASKLQKYSAIFQGVQPALPPLQEFQDLYDFYLQKIVRRLEGVLAEEEKWKKTWEEGVVEEGLEKKSLKDIEVVRRDDRYDLFYIKDEAGRPYFNKNLLRHIGLVGEFDALFNSFEGEDPFLRMKGIQDKEVHQVAQKILKEVHPTLDAFFKGALHYKSNPFIFTLMKASMALMLAGNPRNLLYNAAPKSCVRYYGDFLLFLRDALSTAHYTKYLDSLPEEDEGFFSGALHLIHTLCVAFFMTEVSSSEIDQLIRKMVHPENPLPPAPFNLASPMAIWHNLINEDEKIRHFLKHYPSGPLMKAVDILKEVDFPKCFDPLAQGHLPSSLFSFSWGDYHVTCLRLPCPTSQSVINKADVNEEFKGYLRSFESPSNPQKLLIINLQNRLSWQEKARSKALEDLAIEPEFSEVLSLTTLSKEGSFYHQLEEYRADIKASAFMDQCYEQIEGGEGVGFWIPEKLLKQILAFCDQLMPILHQEIFGSKEILTRKNRLDFIELIYLFLSLKLIEIFHPTLIGFTCKDGVDVSSCATAGLFCLLKILKTDTFLSEEEQRFIQWMLYSQSLSLRERAIDLQRMSRMISALSILHAQLQRDRAKTLNSLEKILPKDFLSSLELKRLG